MSLDEPMTMLPQLFSGQSLYKDTDGDGLIDQILVSLVVPRGLSWSVVWAEAVHLACRLAFETVRLQAPLVRFRPPSDNHPHMLIRLPTGQTRKTESLGSRVHVARKNPYRLEATAESPEAIASFFRLLAISDVLELPPLPKDWSILEWIHGDQPLLRVWKGNRRHDPFFSHSISSAKATLLNLGTPGATGSKASNDKSAPDLLDLSGHNGVFQTSAQDPRQRSLHLAVLLPSPKVSSRIGLSLCHTLSQVTLEATQIHIPFVFSGPVPHEGIVLELKEESACCEALIHTVDGKASHLMVRGSVPALQRALQHWLLWVIRRPGPGAEPMTALREKARRVARPVGGGMADPHATNFPCLVRECRWKPEDLRTEKLVMRVPPGHGAVSATIFVSKPSSVRRRLKERLEKILKAKGYKPSVEVFNAYKPGLCWLLEKVLPAAAAAHKENGVGAVEVSFAPFEGTQGSRLTTKTPNGCPGSVGSQRASLEGEAHVLQGKNAITEKLPYAMETRSRWLQELYPGPDLLARHLGLDLSKVHLRMDPNLQSVYRVRVWDREGCLLFEETWSPRWKTLSYFGSLATVHPTTAGVHIVQASHVLIDRSIPTDREVFWRIFSTRWVPALFRAMEQRLDYARRAQLPAFWEEIRVTATIDETELPLGLDQERLSPMEALHEDVYFALLNAFKDFAARHNLSDFLQLGQVMPVMAWTSRDRKARARLVAKPFPEISRSQQVYSSNSPQSSAYPEQNVSIAWLRLHQRHWDIGFTLSPSMGAAIEPAAAKVSAVLGQGAIPSSTDQIVLRCPAPRHKPPSAKILEPQTMVAPPTQRILSSRDLAQWVHRLASLPALEVWQPSKTFRGRPIWALEATLPYPSPNVSQARLRLFKPTLFFNARHHANEVSSTEAALFSAWKAGTTEKGLKLLRKVNLVWIPLENADGVAAFERLYRINPGHKLHAARYNALGCEFYEDYFKDNPRFPEALAKRHVWDRWLPEMILDGHGVPSHEWEQPFSGYLPGLFAEHWIPRAFLYAYLPYLDEPTNPRYSQAIELARIIQKHVQQDQELVQRNEEIRERYHRYAQMWEPQIFPSVTPGSVALLPPVARVARLNYCAQQPQVTRFEVITEVVDEVAEGSWLNLCVRGHLAVYEAMIEMLQTNAKKAIKTATIFGRRVCFTWGCES
ncbi:MAG: M14 family zinc carboxypeptidase [Desulfosoma sp.]